MIYLVSSSQTRVKLLKEYNIKFKQINFNYDETGVKKDDPISYAYKVVSLKQKQFKSFNNELKNLLFADSCVVVDEKIFGKAKNDDEAIYMLEKQSNNFASIISAFIFEGDKKSIVNLSITTYKFAKFDKKDIDEYIKNKTYLGKAGAMMIEGFNKKYIISQKGNTSTAMGLNIEALKAYL